MLCQRRVRVGEGVPGRSWTRRPGRQALRAWENSSVIDKLVGDLERDGVVGVPNLFAPEQLKAMQQAFDARLKRLRWNNLDGYEKTEPDRHIDDDVWDIEQGVV